MKRTVVSIVARGLAAAVALFVLSSCPALFADFDNPVDPDSAGYQGYPTVQGVDDIALVSAWNGDCTSSMPSFMCVKVLDATAYHLQISSANDFSILYLVFEDQALVSNRVESAAISDSFTNEDTYYWRMRAYKGGWGSWSPVASFTVHKHTVALPVLSPPPGRYLYDPIVTVSCATPGAAMYYTRDDTLPSPTNGTRIVDGDTITVDIQLATKVKIRAYMTGLDPNYLECYYTYDPFPMAYVPDSGSLRDFLMGSTVPGDEQPIHRVTLEAFRISRYEITQTQFQSVMGYNPSGFPGNADADRCPVENVSWFDAVEFCNLLSESKGRQPVYTIDARTPATGHPITAATVTADLSRTGYRLPTEAQWEFAARGGTTGTYYWGEATDDATVGLYAWFSANAGGTTHAVGQKMANAYGLYDTAGNVWEWCNDWYGTYPDTAQVDPTGVVSGTKRILRGASWDRTADYLRTANRNSADPGSTFSNYGFRVALPYW